MAVGKTYCGEFKNNQILPKLIILTFVFKRITIC